MVRFILTYRSNQVNKILDQFESDLSHIGFQVNLSHYNFGSIRFWISSILNFGSKSIQLFLMSVRVWFWVVRIGPLLPGLDGTNYDLPHVKVQFIPNDGGMLKHITIFKSAPID